MPRAATTHRADWHRRWIALGEFPRQFPSADLPPSAVGARPVVRAAPVHLHPEVDETRSNGGAQTCRDRFEIGRRDCVALGPQESAVM